MNTPVAGDLRVDAARPLFLAPTCEFPLAASFVSCFTNVLISAVALAFALVAVFMMAAAAAMALTTLA